MAQLRQPSTTNSNYSLPSRSLFSEWTERFLQQQTIEEVPKPQISLQLQRPSMQQYSFANNRMSNAVLAGNTSAVGMDGKRMSLNMTHVKKQTEVIDKALVAELREDFAKIAEMTLMDDQDIMYTIFMKSPSMMNNEFMFNLLSNLYREKYIELNEKYPSLQVWSAFCISNILASSESYLKSICSSSTINVPQSGRHSAFEIMSRKRAIETEADNEHRRKRAKNAVIHPLETTELYKTKHSLFNIGKMTKYCVPAEFALMFVDATQGMCTKIVTNNEETSFSGIRGIFKRPVIISLQFRQMQSDPLINVPFMENLCALISKMTDLNIENEVFSMGTNDSMDVNDIMNKSTIPYMDEETDSQDFFMGVLTNFQCVATDASTVDIRSYVDVIYKLSDSIIRMPNYEVSNMENLNESKEDELNSAFNEYETKLKSTNDRSEEQQSIPSHSRHTHIHSYTYVHM